MPWAKSPAAIPVSTSPAPAVARYAGRIGGDAGAAVGRRNHRIAALDEHDRTRSSRLPDAPCSSFDPTFVRSSKAQKNRENSPSCGVRIVARPRAREKRLREPLRIDVRSS